MFGSLDSQNLYLTIHSCCLPASGEAREARENACLFVSRETSCFLHPRNANHHDDDHDDDGDHGWHDDYNQDHDHGRRRGRACSPTQRGGRRTASSRVEE